MSATGHETHNSAAEDSRSAESSASNSRPSRLPSTSRESSKQRSGRRSSSPRSRSSSGDSSAAIGREMVGGCCVCADERGWDENPLVYCDGEGCNVAVHQGELRETFVSCEVDCIIQTVNIGPTFPYQRMH